MSELADKLTFKRKVIIAIITGIFVVVAAFIAGIIPLTCNSPDEPPEFHLDGCYFHPDSILIVKAINKSAQKLKSLVFVIDGFRLTNVAKAIEKKDSVFWMIPLKTLRMSDKLRCDGIHKVNFGFSPKSMGIERKIEFDSSPPKANICIIGDRPGKKNIRGLVKDNVHSKGPNISVEISFNYPQMMKTYELPVSYYADTSGQLIYKFEYEIQNIPHIKENDPLYFKSFFSLKIKDGAKNEFIHETTYSKFIAQGVEKFGNSIAQVEMRRVNLHEISATSNKSGTEARGMPRKIDKSPPLIVLQLQIKSKCQVALSWTRLPRPLSSGTESYLVLRQNRVVATSFDTTFVDDTFEPQSINDYKVLAEGRKNRHYPSNIVTYVPSADSTGNIVDNRQELVIAQKIGQLKASFKDTLDYYSRQQIVSAFKERYLKGEKFKKEQQDLERFLAKSLRYQKKSDRYEKYSWFHPLVWWRFFYYELRWIIISLALGLVSYFIVQRVRGKSRVQPGRIEPISLKVTSPISLKGIIDVNSDVSGELKVAKHKKEKSEYSVTYVQIFRSKPAELDEADVKKMLKDLKLFDSDWNKTSKGFNNQLEATTIKGKKIVSDKNSGLMWQQGGSSEYVNYEKAEKYIQDLNEKNYAGFNDWRLPTLEQAMSLMEPEKKNKGLYIDPLFDTQQEWIWTCDPVKGEPLRVWVVGFSSGYCSHDHRAYGDDYVRAVRSGQLSG